VLSTTSARSAAGTANSSSSKDYDWNNIIVVVHNKSAAKFDTRTRHGFG